jgi:GT2 family glycosyltransferase
VKVVWGGKGLSAQRNRIMQAGDADILVFLDDDYVAAADYLAHCEAVFRANPDVVMLTGSVIEDGVFGPGLDLAYALRRLGADPGAQTETLTPTYNGYGCNMAFRTAPMRRHELRFDENLPLYGWLEDVDFSRSLAPYGRIVRSRCCRGVHLGVKRGRTSGVRLGYSQVANPVYLWRKGRMGGRRAFAQVLRNLAANTAKYFFAEPWVDRKGRLHGNLRAMADALLGKLHPTRMLGL